jgi:hypothetical protein
MKVGYPEKCDSPFPRIYFHISKLKSLLSRMRNTAKGKEKLQIKPHFAEEIRRALGK